MTTGMPARRMVRILLALLIASAGCLSAAGTAQAGGPTSALLVSPGAERAAAVYYSDAEYQQLNTLLGGDSPEPDPAASSASRASGDYITVTWLIHDVSVWRIDRIFIGASDGPWIATQLSMDGDAGTGMYPGQAGNDTAVTHRSPDPVALQKLLSSLGLVGPAAAGRLVDAGDVTSSDTPVAASVDARSGSAWWWALAGLVIGVLLTAVAARFLPAIRGRLVGPAVDDQPMAGDDGLIRMTPLSR